jgi:hypothetical protein
MIPVYATLRRVNADKIRKMAQRKREGRSPERYVNFPDPVLQFPYYDLYLTSEFDAYYFPDGVPDEEPDEVGAATTDGESPGIDMSVYAARSGVRPVATVIESGRTMDYVRMEAH